MINIVNTSFGAKSSEQNYPMSWCGNSFLFWFVVKKNFWTIKSKRTEQAQIQSGKPAWCTHESKTDPRHFWIPFKNSTDWNDWTALWVLIRSSLGRTKKTSVCAPKTGSIAIANWIETSLVLIQFFSHRSICGRPREGPKTEKQKRPNSLLLLLLTTSNHNPNEKRINSQQ